MTRKLFCWLKICDKHGDAYFWVMDDAPIGAVKNLRCCEDCTFQQVPSQDVKVTK